ncbi:MAG: SDR family oxidoreductase [Rhodospirillales bacterium]|nr:SDR family oxidoreductase [Rhodospirillales bacterium]MBO6787687.1 SDR family oxidoreductase [Rhodospirillales bacterium]
MKHVVVTGGFGYVGGRVVQALMAAGQHVRVSTRRQGDTVPQWARDQHAAGRLSWGRDLAALCVGADAILHLAAPNETEFADDPAAAVRRTVDLTRSALAAAGQAGVRQFIYFSTVHVYGKLAGTIDETTPLDPQNGYADAHRQSEDLAAAAAGDGMQSLILRLSNGFGAPADAGAGRWTLLVNDLCRQAVRDGTLTLSSSGQQWRDFIPLTDVAGAVSHFLGDGTPSTPVTVLNLSRGESMTVRRMAEIIRERARAIIDPEIGLSGPPPGDGPDEPPLQIDNHALVATGFRPSTPAETEIDGMLNFCKATFAPGL